MPQSDGVAKVAAGGRDDICALDGKSLPISLRRWLLTSSLVGSPIRVRRFPLNYDISVHLGMGVSPHERTMMYQRSILSIPSKNTTEVACLLTTRVWRSIRSPPSDQLSSLPPAGWLVYSTALLLTRISG